MRYSVHTGEMQALRTWLRKCRRDQELSMRELAEKLGEGTPHSLVQKVEEGDRRLDVVEYMWYCEALGVNANEGFEIIKDVYMNSIPPK